MKFPALAGATALAAAMMAPASTASIVIDFETQAEGIFDSLVINGGGVEVTVTREDGTDRRLGILDTSFPGGADQGNDEDLFNSPLSGDLIEVDVNGVETVTQGVTLDLGNVLFGQNRREDDDGDAPNDDRRGAEILFSFSPVLDMLTELILVDAEEEGATVTVTFDSAPAEVLELSSGGLNNSARIYALEFGPGVSSVLVDFNGSGAVGALEFDATDPIPEPAQIAFLFGTVVLGLGWVRRQRVRRTCSA